MADTHEEQLLSELLRDIAREDALLEAAHLEARVLESASPVDARSRRSRAWMLVPVAATVLIAVGITVRLKPDTTEATGTATVRLKPDTTEATDRGQGAPEVATVENPSPVVRQASKPASVGSVRLQPDRRPDLDRSLKPNQPPVAESPMSHAPIEFVPLMPLTEQELTGSFQIVRVQMSSASLGALRPPLSQPNEIVEADVLLGEDGRARAIRVNTNGSIYPWRSR